MMDGFLARSGDSHAKNIERKGEKNGGSNRDLGPHLSNIGNFRSRNETNTKTREFRVSVAFPNSLGSVKKHFVRCPRKMGWLKFATWLDLLAVILTGGNKFNSGLLNSGTEKSEDEIGKRYTALNSANNERSPRATARSIVYFSHHFLGSIKIFPPPTKMFHLIFSQGLIVFL